MRLYFDAHAGKYWSTPPDTKAFLYYLTLRERPRIAGELRLRVVSSDDPASFESGSDFLKSNGQPWSRSLLALSKTYAPLYEKLREEGFVPDELDTVLSTFFPKMPRGHPLYTLNDTFIINFNSHKMYFSIISEQGVKALRFCGPFYNDRNGRKTVPYTGAYTNHHLFLDL